MVVPARASQGTGKLFSRQRRLQVPHSRRNSPTKKARSPSHSQSTGQKSQGTVRGQTRLTSAGHSAQTQPR